MKIVRRPMPATVLFGLVCGILFVPVTVALSYVFSWSTALRATLWFWLASYGFLLARWGKVNFAKILFPLLIVFLFVCWGSSARPFLLLSLGILSWIRSGICFHKPLPGMLGTELFLSVGGGALVAYFMPHSPATWAMGLWMFFLIQSLYFLVVRDAGHRQQDVSLDPFEQARRRAEEILSDGVTG
jgi:hypothetical protein